MVSTKKMRQVSYKEIVKNHTLDSFLDDDDLKKEGDKIEYTRE